MFHSREECYFPEDGIQFVIPMTMELSGVTYTITLEESGSDFAVYICGSTRGRADFAPDCIRVQPAAVSSVTL